MIKDKYEFHEVWDRYLPDFRVVEIMSLDEAVQLIDENDVLIQHNYEFTKFRLGIKNGNKLVELEHDLPQEFLYRISTYTLGVMEVKTAEFNYWYNQFDPNLKDFDEIKYLFETNNQIQE